MEYMANWFNSLSDGYKSVLIVLSAIPWGLILWYCVREK